MYKDVWGAAEGEVLPCAREGNIQDPFAVAVKKSSTTVGHVPRKVSAICSMFLRRGGSIVCRVVGGKRYSRDLPQGGLEIPCILTFSGESKLVDKAELLLNDITTEMVKQHENSEGDNEGMGESSKPPDLKRRKTEHWILVGGLPLTLIDKEVIVNGLELNDLHMTISQKLLSDRFPSIVGLRTPLVPVTEIGSWIGNYLQIFHCRGNHWITVSTIGCRGGEVRVYDTIFTSIDDNTKRSIKTIFSPSNITITAPGIQRQAGAKDCGLYAIAIATYLAYGKDPDALCSHHFNQELLRGHLVSCLEDKLLVEFP